MTKKISVNIFFILLILLFSACSSLHIVEYANIKQLHTLPQRADAYTKNIKNVSLLYQIQTRYNKSYFKPWNISAITTSLHAIMWPFRNYTIFNSYGANLKPLKLFWFYRQYANANYKNYATLNRYAITLRYASLHNFPSDTPVFTNPTKAGEGFPFDYNQNSTVDANKPVIISHYSRDRAWVYVFTSFASGWLRSDDIAYISHQDTKTYQDEKFIHILQDAYPIVDHSNQFICYTRVGMMLPLIKTINNNYEVAVATRDNNKSVVFKDILIPKQIATTKVLNFNKKNIIKVTNAIIHSKYGWGGIDGQRDCSSFVRDFFAPFGIWLPRNSYAQAHVGKIISLRHISNLDKIKLIKKDAIAFETLLYMRGHILIYVGIYHNKIIVLQNMWGINIKNGHKTGRIIIGHTVFTTLTIGSHQKFYDKKASFLNKITSFNILTKS